MSSKELWLEAPDGHFADNLKWIIHEWDDEPSATQILKALDFCAYTGGASTFAMKCLNLELQDALAKEGVTKEQIDTFAALSWRNSPPFTE